MTGMLNTLLDINQIEVGAVKAETADVSMNELFDRLRDELTYHAQATGLVLRVLPCAQFVRSDPRLLEQMVRNLLSNALKYTQRGKVLVGCRRRGGTLRIEIWDTGIGIPDVGAAGDLRGILSDWTTPLASEAMASAWVCRSSRALANFLVIASGCARWRERARCSRLRSQCRRAAPRRRLPIVRAAPTRCSRLWPRARERS